MKFHPDRLWKKLERLNKTEWLFWFIQQDVLIICIGTVKVFFWLSVRRKREAGKTVSEVGNPVSRIGFTSRLIEKMVSRPVLQVGGSMLPRSFVWQHRTSFGTWDWRTCCISPAVPLVCTIFSSDRAVFWDVLMKNLLHFARRSARLHYLFIR